MPWHEEPKKDVTNYEKRRGVVSKQRSVDIRMGDVITSYSIHYTKLYDQLKLAVADVVVDRLRTAESADVEAALAGDVRHLVGSVH